MSDPLVSVVTSVYNCEKFIEESMRSIFDQTFTDFEFIIFNDCSTDKTWEIMERVALDFNGDITIINSQDDHNIGCGPGRDIGIKRARGKYIATQDGDDISYKHRLEREADFMEAHPDIFCVSSWADNIYEDGSFMKLMNDVKECHDDIIDDFYKMMNNIADPTSFFRKDIFNKLGGYGADWSLIPDCYLWIKAILDGQRFAGIQEQLVAHRKNYGGVICNHLRQVVLQHRMLHKMTLAKHKKEVFQGRS